MQSLTYNEHPIAIRGEMLNLTDMWKAAGGDDMKRPARWLESKPVQEFIECVSAQNVGNSDIIRTGRGRNGSTSAHWQIGLAYAKYLSHEFHAWCNTVVRERMEAKAAAVIQEPAAIDMKAVGGMIKGVIRKALDDAINDMLPSAIEERLAADPKMVATSDFMPALQIALDRQVPKKGRRRVVAKISAAVSAFAEVHDYRIRRDWSGRKLFDRAAVRHWLADGGWAPIKDLIDNMGGQSTLRLVPKKPG